MTEENTSPIYLRAKALHSTQPQQKPQVPYISDKFLYSRWHHISQHLTGEHTVKVVNNMLIIDNQFIIAKNNSKMRLIGILDWVHYTPKTLALAMNTAQVEDYYQSRLTAPKTTPNVWRDPVEELVLKTYYADRAGRTL